MCLFPLPNFSSARAYERGLTEFSCGSCPECLASRANALSLRAYYEAKAHAYNCMITLTYDNYSRDSAGRIIGELPPDRDLHVCKRDVQLFIKRLRKWWSTISSEHIKYLATAEYGSKTHRAHYHVILFGVRFPDLVKYKVSKRNNVIYTSPILSSLWKHGICTVDSINVNSAVAHYCTKYCAKSRSEDTFSLMSQGLGLSELLKDFNGRSYTVEGRLYPVPRIVWNHYIYNVYLANSEYSHFTFKYVNFTPQSYLDGSFELNKLNRRLFYAFRDSLPEYSDYLQFWHTRISEFDKFRPSVYQRILLLPDSKYHSYKALALECLSVRKTLKFYPSPNSKQKSAHERFMNNLYRRLGICINHKTCTYGSCLISASDTKYPLNLYQIKTSKNFKPRKGLQLKIFDDNLK